MFINTKHKGYMPHSNHTSSTCILRSHFRSLVTSGLCCNSGKGEQKMLLCFLHTLAKCLDWECVAGHKYFEGFPRPPTPEYFFFQKTCALLYCTSWKYLAYCMYTVHIWFIYVEYTFGIYWLSAKQFEALHSDSDLVVISPEIPGEHLKTKTTSTCPNYT